MDPAAVATAIARDIDALPARTTPAIRAVRHEYSKRLRDADGTDVLAVADALTTTHRWVGYELVYHHGDATAALDRDWVTRLGRELDGWAAVDAFARYIAGPAWRRRQIPDTVVRTWASDPSRWWRRAAVVSTVPLNLRAAGGDGDTARTLDICVRVVDDRDDMVVKACRGRSGSSSHGTTTRYAPSSTTTTMPSRLASDARSPTSSRPAASNPTHPRTPRCSSHRHCLQGESLSARQGRRQGGSRDAS